MRQVRATVSKPATATSPCGLRLPKLILRHCTAQRRARSAALLVGSTPSLSRNVQEPFKVQAQRSRQIAQVLVAAVEMSKRQSEELLRQRNGFQNQLFSCDRPV